MKRFLLILGLFLQFCASAQIDKVVPSKPAASEGLVHDFAGILSGTELQYLRTKLVAYDDSTSNQIVIVTLPTLMDPSGTMYEDEEVALKILREWGVGQKDKNNGIVILVVKNKDNTERKIRIEVGYGLEGAIPDVIAKRIIDNEIVPQFKEGHYYAGLNAATDAIIKAAVGEYKAPANYNSRKNKKGINGFWLVAAIIIFLIFGGLGGGGRGGTYVSRGGFGGWSGGGGGWSGGGGGGGFGGFGGGSGGGGGASGSW